METTQATFDPIIRENPMGEARKDALWLDFDNKLKLEFHGTKAISDAGLLACRRNGSLGGGRSPLGMGSYRRHIDAVQLYHEWLGGA